MCNLLKKAGVSDIHEASDGLKAIRFLERDHVDLILVDLYMPKSNGFDVISYVRNMEIRNDIPVIVVSGEANRADIVKATELGASDYILKPFKQDEFIEKIDQASSLFFNPGKKIKRLREADQHLVDEQYPEALAAAEIAFNESPDSLRARHTKALALKANGKLIEALKLIEEGIDLHPDHYRFHGLKASLLFKLKRQNDGIESLSTELELNPKQIGKQIFMANLQLKSGNPKLAIVHLREALKENPRHKKALLTMAESFFNYADLDKALYYLLRYRRQHPEDTKPLIMIALYCKALKEDKKAEHAIKTEINNNPGRLDAYAVLTMFHMSNNNSDKAFEILELLFKRDPDNIDGLRLRGSVFMTQKDYQAAEASFLRASELAPSVDTFTPLAKAQSMLGKTKEVISTCEKALILDSKSSEVSMLLANAYMEGRQPRKAYFLAQKALSLGADPKLSTLFKKQSLKKIRFKTKNAKKAAS